MTVRGFLLWYLAAITGVGAVGASGYQIVRQRAERMASAESLAAPATPPQVTDDQPRLVAPRAIAEALPTPAEAPVHTAALLPLPSFAMPRPSVRTTHTPPHRTVVVHHPAHRAVVVAMRPRELPRPPGPYVASYPPPRPPQPPRVAYYAYPGPYAYPGGYAYVYAYPRYAYYYRAF